MKAIHEWPASPKPFPHQSQPSHAATPCEFRTIPECARMAVVVVLTTQSVVVVDIHRQRIGGGTSPGTIVSVPVDRMTGERFADCGARGLGNGPHGHDGTDGDHGGEQELLRHDIFSLDRSRTIRRPLDGPAEGAREGLPEWKSRADPRAISPGRGDGSSHAREAATTPPSASDRITRPNPDDGGRRPPLMFGRRPFGLGFTDEVSNG